MEACVLETAVMLSEINICMEMRN